MSRAHGPRFDEIGYWTEIKIEIVKKYAAAYSTILSKQSKPAFLHVYIDAFAGAGVHVSKETGEYVAGSPMNALLVKPSFKEYHFIDLDGARVKSLKTLTGKRSDVHVYEGDCNDVLLARVFPRVKFEDYCRGLCLLDPYGLHLDWRIIETAGRMKSLDMFLNFPVMDMNMNALWRHPQGVGKEGVVRMTAFWGDESWRKVAYPETPGLFGAMTEKASNDAIAEAFRLRLNTVAGFAKVAKPLPMRNTKGAVVYYLFFASQKPVAHKIVTDIFKKYELHKGA